jgi:hypothetical protein
MLIMLGALNTRTLGNGTRADIQHLVFSQKAMADEGEMEKSCAYRCYRDFVDMAIFQTHDLLNEMPI